MCASAYVCVCERERQSVLYLSRKSTRSEGGGEVSMMMRSPDFGKSKNATSSNRNRERWMTHKNEEALIIALHTTKQRGPKNGPLIEKRHRTLFSTLFSARRTQTRTMNERRNAERNNERNANRNDDDDAMHAQAHTRTHNVTQRLSWRGETTF